MKFGYVREDVAIKQMEKAGFKLAGTSQVNNNPKRHQGLSRRRMDLAAELSLGRQGSRQIPGHRRERPLHPSVCETMTGAKPASTMG